MILDILFLDGYGSYVWPAFIFTLTSCYVLYLQIKKEYKKQEKIFFTELNHKKFIKIKSKKAEALSENLIY